MTMLGEGIVASPVACLDFPLLFLTVKVHNTSSPNFSLVKFFVEESDSGYGCGGEHPDPAHPNSLGPLLPPGLWAAPVFGPHFWTTIWEHFLTLLKTKKSLFGTVSGLQPQDAEGLGLQTHFFPFSLECGEASQVFAQV